MNVFPWSRWILVFMLCYKSLPPLDSGHFITRISSTSVQCKGQMDQGLLFQGPQQYLMGVSLKDKSWRIKRFQEHTGAPNLGPPPSPKMTAERASPFLPLALQEPDDPHASPQTCPVLPHSLPLRFLPLQHHHLVTLPSNVHWIQLF